jgi:catechol 2,3-dioxygenase
MTTSRIRKRTNAAHGSDDSTTFEAMAPRPIWNARLFTVERASADPRACAQWYSNLTGDPVVALSDALYEVRGRDRCMWFREGAAKSVDTVVFSFESTQQLAGLQAHLISRGIQVHPCSIEHAKRLGISAFSITDPDRRTLAFCVRPTVNDPLEGALPARLQHFVCATTQPDELLSFYRDVLAFAESDRVVDDQGELTAAFLRSDHEHHSFALFRAPHSGADHHAYEVPDWNAIRDWADRCADLEIPLWWGPGRHGVGNNLFFMIEDPDGYKVEFSAELEHMTPEQAYRQWPHGPRALNLWGNAWMRS